MREIVAGVDIGGRGTSIAFIDASGEIVKEGGIPTLTHEDVNIYIASLANYIKSECDELGSAFELVGIGVGAPDANCITGTIEHAPNLGWGDYVPFVKRLQAYFPEIRIALSNDANATAVGEKVFGGAKQMENFIMLTLGTGVGGGLYVNDQLVIGSKGFAAELGHVNVVPEGRECGCGRLGCLEAYCSASGIERTAIELMSHSREASLLRSFSIEKMQSRDIYDAALKGDTIALETFERTGECLGRAIVDLVCIFNPEAVFLFGGPVQAGSVLLDPVKRGMKKYMLEMYDGSVRVYPSELPNAHAAVLGNAAIVWQQLQS